MHEGPTSTSPDDVLNSSVQVLFRYFDRQKDRSLCLPLQTTVSFPCYSVLPDFDMAHYSTVSECL